MLLTSAERRSSYFDWSRNLGVFAVEQISPGVGLCAVCTHVRRITSDRGSVFFLCALSAVDPGFPKYPRLPVFSCSGYEKLPEQLELKSRSN